MRRTTMTMAGSVLALGLALSACGGGEESPGEADGPSESASESASEPEPTEEAGSEAYCEQLESARQQFDALAEGDLAEFDEAISTLQETADTAPPEIADDWEQLLAPLDQLEAALDKAGLTFGELEALSQGDIPPDVDLQALEQLATEVDALDSSGAEDAEAAITEQASEECGIDLQQ